MEENKLKDLLDLSYFKEKELIEAESEARKDLIINSTEIGKAAKVFINVVRVHTNVRAPRIQDLVSYEMLPFETREDIDGINRRAEVKITELNAKYQTIYSLITLTDNYEQKIDILTRYGIIELPKKTRK